MGGRPGGARGDEEESAQSVGACFDLIERKMFRGPWAMGDAYTIADPYLFTIARWMEVDSVDPAAYPACSTTATGWLNARPSNARSKPRAWRRPSPVTVDRDLGQYSDVRRASRPGRQEEETGQLHATPERARLGAAAGAVLAAGATLDPHKAAAQAASESVLRTALDRGKLIVGTGSTNPPWHFEDDKGELIGMDIAIARILAKGLLTTRAK